MTIAQVASGILFSFLIVAGLGIFFGIVLAIAGLIFKVKKDDRLELLEQALPGLNCGMCGFPGCSLYAEAIGLKHAELRLCLPGGEYVANRLSEVMEVTIDYSIEKKVTQVHCRGGKGLAKFEFEYSGLQDCNAAFSLYGGYKTCKSGCLGLGSCIEVCPVDAINYDKNSLVWVNKDKCIGCGKCIDVCPTSVMQFIPYAADVIVACNSTDQIGRKKRYCTVSCIGCKICELESPGGGYKVENYLSKIDYRIHGERENGKIKCPTSCIVNNR